MAQQIIKQPNGKYCLFSTIVDNVTHYNMSKEEIVEAWTEHAKKEFERKVAAITEKLDGDEKPYFQFTLSYEDMLKTIVDIHSDSEMKEIKELIEVE